MTVLFLYPKPNSLGFPYLSKIKPGLVIIITMKKNKNKTIATKFILFIINCRNIINII